MFLTDKVKQIGIGKIFRNKLYDHVVVYDVLSALLNGTDRTSTELIRLGEINRVKKRLRKKYQHQIDQPLLVGKGEIVNPNFIWTAWLQGESNAPDVVRMSLKSMRIKYGRDNVQVLTAANFKDYIDLPASILNKWQLGTISDAHFSDILRTALLVKYGGTWIDSTVFLSENSGWISETIDNAKFFFFQNMRPGSMGNAIFLSSWYLKSEKGNPALQRVQELLYLFWEKENNIRDYFLFHIFLHLVFEAHPEELDRVPKIPNALPLQLMYKLNDYCSQEEIRDILKTCEIQKLTYKNLPNSPKSVVSMLNNLFLDSKQEG
ncbi:capsular polysaccharide synthesis protein [Lacticaseibacillus rhamnosus]|uniref:capsular polysaccharide synthesis protein n=1 Tax=Lacticaseibacillus rhamnosus TaxID=47715 RepID=UPI0028151228|nr:capsular polysaccharide synthesis protein [Lacticaseibacillus rhamnosus]